jgi:hypothetical protein
MDNVLMTDQQPGDVLDEAAKLFDAVRRRVGQAARAASSVASGMSGGQDQASGAPRPPSAADDDADVWARATDEARADDARAEAARAERSAGRPGPGGRGKAAGEAPDGDVWAHVLAADPHIATGAPECRNCPVCRAIALARESGPDVRRHVEQAGRSLMAAALDVAAAYERTRSGRGPGPGRTDGSGGDARSGRGDRGGDTTDVG